MKKSKTPFEQVIEGQKSLMQDWTAMNKKIMDDFAGKVNGKGDASNFYNQWFENQKELYNAALKSDTPQTATENMMKWWESQVAFSEKSMELLNENAIKRGFELFDPTSFSIQDAFMPESFKQFKKFNDHLSKFFPNDVKDMLNEQFNVFARVYKDLHKYWEPILLSIKGKLTDWDKIKEYMSEDAYKKILDDILSIDSSENVKKMAEQVNLALSQFSNAFDSAVHHNENFLKSFNENASKYAGLDLNSFVSLNTKINESLMKAYAPFVKSNLNYRDSELKSMIQELQSNYMAFSHKSVEMQSKIYDAGLKSYPALLKSFAVSYDDTGKLPEFDEFFKKLIDHIESQVLTVVESMEYSKIQGEVAEHGTKIKEAMNGLSEILFEDVPFVTKNNIDDLASEIASLRAKVRNLEAGVRKTVKKSDKVVA